MLGVIALSIAIQPTHIAAFQSSSKPPSGINDKDQGEKKTAESNGEVGKPPLGPAKVSLEGQVNVSDQAVANAIEAYTQSQSQPPWWKSSDWWTVILTAVASFFAIRAFWLSKLQLRLANSPRLYIEGVRAHGLKHEKRPVFIVTIVNDGGGPAKNVEVSIRVEGKTDAPGVVGHKFSRPQFISIPANSRKQCSVVWTSVLHQQDIDRFNSGSPLLVMGHFKYGKTTEPFSYRYYPWPETEDRPEGLDQFIPSDFDPGLTILMTADMRASAKIELSANATLTDGKKDGEEGDPG